MDPTWFREPRPIEPDKYPSARAFAPSDMCGACPLRREDFYRSIDFYWANPTKAGAEAEEIERQSVSALEHVSDLKSLAYFRCREARPCEWLLDSDRRFLTYVPPSQRAFVQQWGSQNLSPTEPQMEVLLSIGATGAYGWGNQSNSFRIPCKVRLTSGEERDFCIIRLCANPPDPWEAFDPVEEDEPEHRLDPLLITDVAEIMHSDYALPFSVRLASLNAEETSMMFYPTYLAARGQFRFILNGDGYFLHIDGIKGSEISLEGRPATEEHLPLVKSNGSHGPFGGPYKNALPITWIHGDWDESYPVIFGER